MERYTILAGAAGLLAALAAATAANALPVAKSPAAPQGIVEQAGRGGHGHGSGGGGSSFHGGGGPRFHGGPQFGGPRYHRPGGPRFYGGPRFRGGFYPYAYGFGSYYPYYYSDSFAGDYADCAPLRRRAAATGKRYWWNRYYACIEG